MADEFQNPGQNNANNVPDFNQTPDAFQTPNQDFTNPTPDFTQPTQDFTQPTQDFTQTPDLNQDFTNSTPNVDQIQDFTAGATGAGDYGVNPVDDLNAAPTTSIDPGLDNPANTFVEKKTGNRTFLIAAIAGVVILLILAVILVVANLNSGNNDDGASNIDEPVATENTTEPEPTETTTDNTLTGGDNTIASNSRQFNETKIPAEWLLQKFRAPVIDQDGNCINISICGENADDDNDGLENIDEYNFQLDPLVSDLDKDGISDGDELFVYYTDPSEDDSDNDGFKDGEEIGNCYDPTNVSIKFSSDSQSTIATNISLQQLHEPTITTLTNAGVSQTDIDTNGLNVSQCDETAPAGSTNSADTNTTNSNDSVNSVDDSTVNPSTDSTDPIDPLSI